MTPLKTLQGHQETPAMSIRRKDRLPGPAALIQLDEHHLRQLEPLQQEALQSRLEEQALAQWRIQVAEIRKRCSSA